MLKWTEIKTKIIILAALLAAILIMLVSYELYIYSFNKEKRSFNQASENAQSLEITPRTGDTDSWIKRVEKEEETIEYFGVIYDVTLTNNSKFTVSNWTLRIDISEDCYINNAWCGQVEIHQFTSGEEKIQKLDLRSLTKEITVRHMFEGSDLMIPLSNGDYLIYYPESAIANEYPIRANTDNEPSFIVFGLIFYKSVDETMNFTSYQVDYTFSRKFGGSPFAGIIAALSFVWIIFFFVCASTEISMRKARLRNDQDEKIIHQSIGVFTHFFEAKDIYTTGHSQRVAKYAQLVAKKMRMSDDKCRDIYSIALMHDCGKCYIPDSVLKKDGKLTPEEYDIIKSHTVKGAEMLKNFTAIANICDGVKYHHERWDGKGYPEGLSGENIPLISRIICICDSFDAMNSKRCYRDKLSKQAIIDELKNCSGKQFDPEITAVFLSLIDEGKIEF